jgi:hypothetical protein
VGRMVKATIDRALDYDLAGHVLPR